MSPEKLAVAFWGFFGILFIHWFFLMRPKRTVEAMGNIEIIVDGGYSPEEIIIPGGKQTRITFLRKDSNSCLEEVVIPEFKLKKFLPLNKKVTVEITPSKTGEFSFSCGMGMFHGRIIVR